MRVDDPAYVERQYATERGLASRKSIYAEITGEDADALALPFEDGTFDVVFVAEKAT